MTSLHVPMPPQTDLQKLWAESPTKTVFNHPAWFEAVRESFWKKRGEVYPFQVRDAKDNLIGYWPFVLYRSSAKDLWRWRLEPLGALRADYNAPITQPDKLDEVLLTIAEELASLSRAGTLVLLPKISVPLSATHALLSGLSLPLVFTKKRIAYQLRFGENYAQTERQWRQNHRTDTRRRIRRLREKGNVQLFVVNEREEILERLPVLFKLHKEKWNSLNLPSQFDQDSERRFFKELARRLPLEMLHYTELRLNDIPLSCHFGFVCKNWLFWYKPAFNIQYQQYSPGKVHLALLTQWGIDNGLTGIDFLQGQEWYKTLWANETLQTTETIAAHRWDFIPWIWKTRFYDWTREQYMKFRLHRR